MGNWTTVNGTEASLPQEIRDFNGTVTSVDRVSVTSHKDDQIVALLEYTD